MIDLALDPTDTRPARAPGAPAVRPGRLRVVLFGLAAVAGLGAFGVAASSVMAGLAAPPRPSLGPPSRAADWPELKDGLPALAGAPAAPTAAKPADPPPAPALRMASLPETITPPLASPRPAAAAALPQAAAPEPPAKRIPSPIPVAVIGPARQVMPLPPARTAALQAPRPSETVRAREVAEPAVAMPAAMIPAPAVPKAANAAAKPQRKAVAAKAAPAQAAAQASTAVASAEAEPEETEVLGVKLPSLAPAGRKLKESVDALGEAVRNAF